jgi:tyrosyl-tRNA synthetase
MSKSYGNYVAFNDSPQDMYGKIMSISDKLMFDYYELLTFEDLNVVKAKHPMQAKKDLARIITTRFHGTEAASRAKEGFEKVFAKKENPHEMPTFGFKDGESLSAVIVNCGFAKSKNEARRLIEQGGVSLDGAKASRDASLEKDEATLRVGKIRFCKLRKEL